MTEKVTMLTARELAATGILSEYTIRLLLKQNKLPALKVGRKSLINYEKTVEMLNNL